MNIAKLMKSVSSELKRIRSTVEPNAAVHVEQGKAQYVTQTPRSDGRFDMVEISEWMPVNVIAGYLSGK